MKKILVTGAAGFIGSNLVDKLLSKNFTVVGVDNFSTGNKLFLKNAFLNKKFSFFRLDLLNLKKIISISKNCDTIFHLSANADVRGGVNNTLIDLEQNTIVTHNILEAMRKNNIKKLIFSSTGSVYGKSNIIPTPEFSPYPLQTSMYGASKVSCEAMISAYCEAFGIQSWIFRFVSILGERYSHGHVFDFFKKLQNNPKELKILGNGKQRKSYLYIHDCLNAIMISIKYFKKQINIINLGHDDYCTVNQSVKWITKNLNIKPKLIYSGGKQGWIGDNPFIYLDNRKIKKTGWKPKTSIEEGIIKTLNYLKNNTWLLDLRN